MQELSSLPTELLDKLQQLAEPQYLDTLAKLALDPRYTESIYATHEAIFVEISSRWLCCSQSSIFSALAAYARVLPLAPHLADHAADLTDKWRRYIEDYRLEDGTILHQLSVEDLGTFLLAVVRLLLFDNERYVTCVLPVQFSSLLSHDLRYIRYLAIRVFCLYLHASDTALESMIGRYLGDGHIRGPWDDSTIDYTFFSLWEQRRFTRLAENLKWRHSQIASESASPESLQRKGTIRLGNLSSTTASIGSVLVPINKLQAHSELSIVPTESSVQNIRALAEGINGGKPLLVLGLPGSGKTTMIRETARLTGKFSSMITLHLNEQIDAKLLTGLYTSTRSPGMFTWQPGILTTAVMEGRWVLIEDLDRAPIDLISTLLPLIENRELYISNQDNPVVAAPGFKLIATVRTVKNVQGEEMNPATRIIGFRHWHQVKFHASTDKELMETISVLFPLVRSQIPQIKEVYTSLRSLKYGKSSHLRLIGPSDLLRWSRRVQSLLSEAGIVSCEQRITESLQENIFLEAADSFAGYLPQGSLKEHIVSLISQQLHIPKQRAEHSLEYRRPFYIKSKTSLRIGRVTLKLYEAPVFTRNLTKTLNHDNFAATNHVLRALECVARSVQQSEACLLVGETGIGKTAMIQQLAKALGHKLVIMNLSQQSEVADLLGGFKPVNPRTIAISLRAEFDQLLQATFPKQQNQKFLDALAKAIAKGRWSRALVLLKEALRTVRPKLASSESVVEHGEKEPSRKKRKLQSHHAQLIRRWDGFAYKVQNLENHICGGTKGISFSFVEGAIVQAIRGGDWVLLDEINLASPDLLESLADLFTSSEVDDPSILLPETGDTERIHAHKDFRIFGAMNPATDIGKHDLPLSIRSRFTEIFVDPPDSLLSDVVAVVEAYLGDIIQQHVQISTDVAKLYLDIKKLADENRLVDSSSQKPHFSLRTLTRTLWYVTDVASIYGLQRALFEGFSMSFLTMLNTASKSVVQPLINSSIFGSVNNQKASLNQKPQIPKDGKNYVRFRQYWIAQGNYDIQDQAHYIITPFVEYNLHNLVRATSTRRFPVLLQGPTSSGKTSMVEYLAKISGHKFVRINNHEHTDLQEYLGTYKSDSGGHFAYHDGVLVKALKDGHWIVLDELNLAPTDVLEALNRLLDDNRELMIPETQQVVRPHQNFMLFATQNPPGIYGGRKPLSRAFRNRFLELHFDEIPEAELETILRERSQIAPSFCARIVTVYRKLSLLRQSERLFEQRNSFVTLRDLFRWALRNADDRDQLAINGFQLLAERVRNHSERMIVKRMIEDVMRVEIDDSRIYDEYSLLRLGITSNVVLQEITLVKSARRLLVLVIQALKNNEPVLLVGETGSGKTTICQVVAYILKTQLHVVNAHQSMETSDLIGCHRPVRNKSNAQMVLENALIEALDSCSSYREEFGRDLSTLNRVYDQLIQKAANKIPEGIRVRVQEGRARTEALFEWSDGSLITAMSKGQHFLLDEISLADDSVLERLNSVLEPDRTLYLTEKGDSDAVTAVDGFQFLATMNPGGDYGKRELSPALRNRFTEIWVPPFSDKEELTEIIEAKLNSHCMILAKPMIHFAEWFSSRFESSSHVTLSIRDLTSWTEFINQFAKHNLSLAIFDGASMVYLDRLGASPTAKHVIAESDVMQERGACEAKLQSLFQLDKECLSSSRLKLQNDVDSVSIGGFRCPKSSPQSSKLQYSLNASTSLKNAMKMFRALQVNKPILLEGVPGVGKTTLVAILADMIGMPLTRINLSDQTDLMDLFGSDVPIEGPEAGHFGWRDAPFLRAMQKGEWVLLDEMNLAPQTVLEGLNACFDHRGEVYISELGQKFARHPEFVVFAAQNPHYQGGGRKGLPASFINRFTVVYIDPFTQDDLLEICANTFPSSDQILRKNIVQCVSNISLKLQRSPSFCFQGGPWEVNLRDALRWFEISSRRQETISATNPTYYHRLLLTHRFRTTEDRVAIENMVREEFINDIPTHSYFIGKDSNNVEIGLGLLCRDKVHCYPQWSRVSHLPVNLPVAESVMLCIEKSWPVLLVGPSGVGKSTLIRQLAGLVGADISEFCLSPGMDTIDLVGGFERIDTQRELKGFISRLRAYTNSLIIQQLTSSLGLERRLLNLIPNMAGMKTAQELIPLLQTLASSLTTSQYPEFLQECQAHAMRSTRNGKIGFEWVDSLLVKALKQGKWVILDHANLCNPSVLDRLNSLLEPSGYLSIHEHRSGDGSAQFVKPHPRFRLFMTMDPRHGELSRAMRNRSVELFLPSKTSIPLTAGPLLNPAIESSVSRFAWMQSLQMRNFDDDVSRHLLLICIDHLSFADFGKIKDWQSQVVSGLVPLRDWVANFLATVVEIYDRLFALNGPTLESIKEAYTSMGEVRGTEAKFGDVQTIHPYNNPILLHLTAHKPYSQNLQALGQSFELLIEIHLFKHELAGVRKAAESMPPSLRSRTEWYAPSADFQNRQSAWTQLISAFLHDMSLSLENFVDGTHWNEYQDAGDRASMLLYGAEILQYLKDVLDLALTCLCDTSTVQILLDLGRSLSTRYQASAATQLTKFLASELRRKLEAFGSTWRLVSGTKMEALWKVFRPPTAKDAVHFDLSLNVDQLSERFDKVRWSSRASLADLISTQNLLINIHRNFNSAQWPLQEPQMVNKYLEVLEQQSPPSSANDTPYLVEQFDTLRQYQRLRFGYSSDLSCKLNLLSGRPTVSWQSVRLSEAWDILNQVVDAFGDPHSENQLAVIRQDFPLSVSRRLVNSSELPLRSLNLLKTEISILAETTSQMIDFLDSNPIDHIVLLLQKLQEKTLEPLQASMKDEDAREIKNLVDRLPSQMWSRGHGPTDRLGNIRGLHKAIDSVISPSTVDKNVSFDFNRQALLRLANSMIYLFAGYILLYVPDRPYDPASKSNIERDRHVKSQRELRNKIKALEAFEKINSGRENNFRTQIAKKGLAALGLLPKAEQVYRPDKSGVTILQGNFNSILAFTVPLVWEVEELEAACQNDHNYLLTLETRQRDIRTAISKFGQEHKAYDDIIKPLLALLHGLNAALGLARLAILPPMPCSDAIQYVYANTPFMGRRSFNASSMSSEHLQRLSTPKLDLRIHFLEKVALTKNLNVPVPQKELLQVFNTFYQEWKEKLNIDQQKNAVNSSLYKYRRIDTENVEELTEDFQNIFTIDESIPKELSKYHDECNSPSKWAQKLARIHSKIFGSCGDPTLQLLYLLKYSYHNIAYIWSEKPDKMLCPVQGGDLLSPMLLLLDEQKEQLHNALSAHSYNFYTEKNAAEAENLLKLVEQVVLKFSSLQKVWPEHATLSDILDTCTELLAMRHSEPIAKFLTKLEQLHSYIHDWQTIASKEYSGVEQYNRVTQQLIKWRKLELSTWTKLLSMEDERCEIEADSWWFLVYETVIAAPLSMIGKLEEIESYTTQCIATLQDFLHTTPIGLYSRRMKTLRAFYRHISLLAEENSSFLMISSALYNFLGFFERFEPTISERMQNGRHVVEKELKETLVLASWKDTNIEALRQSTKRSHQRLFKIIRKYRFLLGEPVNILLEQNLPIMETTMPVPLVIPHDIEINHIDRYALETCKMWVDGWTAKPDRFKDPIATVKRMRQVTEISATAIDASEYLDQYSEELLLSIKTLRKETPESITKTNTELVKHLKSRKRKLYSDTMKDLRHMGIQANMSTDLLNRQHSVAIVLSRAPSFENIDDKYSLSRADCEFQDILHMITQARTCLQEHHEDLSQRDIARSMGYLECILSNIIEQRRLVATVAENLTLLQRHCQKMDSTWQPEIYNIYSKNQGSSSHENVCTSLVWLPAILGAAIIVIEKYENARYVDKTELKKSLNGWKNEVSNVAKKVHHLPNLPDGLTSSIHTEVFTKAFTKIRELHISLESWAKSDHDVVFVLRQVQAWTAVGEEGTSNKMKHVSQSSLSEFDARITYILDYMLVVIQGVTKRLAALPTSDEEPKWLSSVEVSLTGVLKTLQMQNIADLLDGAVKELGHLGTPDHSPLSIAAAVCALALPIIHEFHSIAKAAMDRFVRFHISFCRLGSTLSRIFLQISKNGFCNPSNDSATQEGTTEKFEGGTGLGDGEGAEDISKEVEEDEDLSELTHQSQRDNPHDMLEDREDAVDMDRDELSGKFGDTSDEGDEVDSNGRPDESDIDEEKGEVDGQDSNKVDENIWDGKNSENSEGEMGGNTKQHSITEERVAAHSEEQAGGSHNVEENEARAEDETSQQGAEESEAVTQNENEQMDTDPQSGQSLNLSDEAEVDNSSEIGSESSLGGEGPAETSSDVDDPLMSQDSEVLEEKGDKFEAMDQHEYDKDSAVQDVREEDDNKRAGMNAGSTGDNDSDSQTGQNDEREESTNYVDDHAEDLADPPLSEAQGLGRTDDQELGAQQEEENAQEDANTQANSTDKQDKHSRSSLNSRADHLDDPMANHAIETTSTDDVRRQAFKKLGDALEEWHRHQRQILDSSETARDSKDKSLSVDLQNHDIEHLPNDSADANGQALGAALDDEAQMLDARAFDSENQTEQQRFPSDSAQEGDSIQEDHKMEDAEDLHKDVDESTHTKRPAEAFLSTAREAEGDHALDDINVENEAEIHSLDQNMSITHASPTQSASTKTVDELHHLWAHYENTTRDLSLYLTEQLRLILAPTLATKMRGDFRTGKRLNMKRIIPYIASQYKKDKIWMRRSIPTKRNYQIMLAFDDSQSMEESGSGQLAFQTLALVSRSLSMLEAGQVCVIGFGDEVVVAHDFDKPLSTEAGAHILSKFSFRQTRTNVRTLIAESIKIFRDARCGNFSGGTDLWQLELIISDGVCEDHEAIRRLVRKAQEERIMMVFVIVDALKPGESIIDMSQAAFEPDASGENKLKIKRYLDSFPFPYYVVVGDVKDLPTVLVQALRQWFAEVVDSN